MGTGELGPAVNLPLPSVPVGQHPEAIDDWRRQYHPDQVVMGGVKQGLRVVDPLVDPRFDPFFDYPLDPIPPATPDGAGGLTVPEARHVG